MLMLCCTALQTVHSLNRRGIQLSKGSAPLKAIPKKGQDMQWAWLFMARVHERVCGQLCTLHLTKALSLTQATVSKC